MNMKQEKYYTLIIVMLHSHPIHVHTFVVFLLLFYTSNRHRNKKFDAGEYRDNLTDTASLDVKYFSGVQML
jgi:hypothetical protein